MCINFALNNLSCISNVSIIRRKKNNIFFQFIILKQAYKMGGESMVSLPEFPGVTFEDYSRLMKNICGEIKTKAVQGKLKKIKKLIFKQ